LLDLFHPFFSKWNHFEKEGVLQYMQRLAECLQIIEDSDLPDVPQHEDNYLSRDDHELVSEVISLATTLFVGEQGQGLFDIMDQLQEQYGYFIFPGERDRFGWVTGCLQTKKGIIVFG
jgi:hypothetical protein